MSDGGIDFEQAISAGLVETRFSLVVDGERVPGMAVHPEAVDDEMPLVLIQHPATSSKDDYFVADVGREWARRGWVCAGIDAPLHGDRDEYDPMRIFQDRARLPEVAAQFGRELSATIDLLEERLPVDMTRLGYVGYSMGSMLGVPAVARDRRFRAAAFCLVGEGGLVGPATGEDSVVGMLGGVAVRIVAKANDELVPRASTEALYDALPGERDIVWLPGGHFEIGPNVIAAAEGWLAAHLG